MTTEPVAGFENGQGASFAEGRPLAFLNLPALELEIVRPWDVPKNEVIAFRDAFYDAGETVINGSAGLDFYSDTETWLAYLGRVEHGEEVGFVPSRVYFAVQGKTIAGVLDIRPTLPKEKETYGHIGYAVRPGFRGQGIAPALAEWGVIELRRQGVCDILVACYEGNEPSRRVLEKCSFTVLGTEVEEETGKTVINFINTQRR